METKPSELSQTEHQKIFDFLASHPIGVLATVDDKGNPHASTIYFSLDRDLNIFFTTKRDTAKHRNISGNNKVMLAVYEPRNQAAVQLTGIANATEDPAAVQAIFRGTLHAAEKTSEDIVPPVAKIFAGPYIAYKVSPSNIWMSNYGWGDNFAKALKQAGKPDSGGDPS